jgi:hypothetical protein
MNKTEKLGWFGLGLGLSLLFVALLATLFGCSNRTPTEAVVVDTPTWERIKVLPLLEIIDPTFDVGPNGEMIPNGYIEPEMALAYWTDCYGRPRPGDCAISPWDNMCWHYNRSMVRHTENCIRIKVLMYNDAYYSQPDAPVFNRVHVGMARDYEGAKWARANFTTTLPSNDGYPPYVARWPHNLQLNNYPYPKAPDWTAPPNQQVEGAYMAEMIPVKYEGDFEHWNGIPMPVNAFVLHVPREHWPPYGAAMTFSYWYDKYQQLSACAWQVCADSIKAKGWSPSWRNTTAWPCSTSMTVPWFPTGGDTTYVNPNVGGAASYTPGWGGESVPSTAFVRPIYGPDSLFVEWRWLDLDQWEIGYPSWSGEYWYFKLGDPTSGNLAYRPQIFRFDEIYEAWPYKYIGDVPCKGSIHDPIPTEIGSDDVEGAEKPNPGHSPLPPFPWR